MNPSISWTRCCVQQCCRARVSSKPAFTRHQRTRLISSSISRFDAQPTKFSSENKLPQDVALSFDQISSVETSQQQDSRTTTSRLPSDQSRPPPSQLYTGTVTRTGTMPQTVQITRMNQVFDSFLQKHYTRPLRIRVHDPNPPNYLREGDIVEYGVYTQAEKDAKAAKEANRIHFIETKLSSRDKTGKTLRRFQRSEATRKRMQGNKIRGVQFVVRKVVTPFGVGLDERMEKLSVTEDNTLAQERSSEGGQDSLLRGLGGSVSRQSGRASVAG